VVAVVAVLGLVVLAVVVLRDDSDVHVDPGEPPVEPVEAEVLAVGAAVEPMGTVRAAATAEGYEALWASSGLEGELPAVDIAEQVVVSMTIPDDACPPALTGFRPDGDVLTPVFVEPGGGCDAPLIPKTYVAAIDRDAIGSTFTVLLPGKDDFGFGDTTSVVHLDDPPPQAECAVIGDFVDLLEDNGIPIDHQPTGSPTELLEPTAAAFRGLLTGGSGSVEDIGYGVEGVGLEVQVIEQLFVGADAPALHERELVFVDVADAAPFVDAAPALAGVPVVVVAEPHPPEQPRLVPDVEGLATACEGGPLLGRTGFLGEWAEVDSLDELADALRG
jgi:hypothetical protein